jgi:hypothetical protein
MSNKQFIPALTLLTPQEGDDPWLVTLNDYDPNDPQDISTAQRFDTKEEAEAFIREKYEEAWFETGAPPDWWPLSH